MAADYSRHMVTALQQGETVIDGIAESRLSPGIEIMLAQSDGLQYPTFATLKEARPSAEFTCLEISAITTLLGLTPTLISATALELFTVGVKGASRSASGEKINITNGVLVPVRLSAQGNEPATISYQVFLGGADDAAVPYAVTSNQTAPVAPGAAEQWVLGPATLDGSDIGPVTSLDIAFGYEVEQVMGDGDLYPNFVFVKSMKPTITIRTQKATALADLTVDGAATVLAAGLVGCASGGGRSGSLTFTSTEQLVIPSELSAPQADLATLEIISHLVHDGTNHPITVS